MQPANQITQKEQESTIEFRSVCSAKNIHVRHSLLAWKFPKKNPRIDKTRKKLYILFLFSADFSCVLVCQTNAKSSRDERDESFDAERLWVLIFPFSFYF